MKTLRTERLTLRQWYLSDADDLFAYASSPLVGPSAGWKPHQTRSDSELLIKKLFQVQLYHWAIILNEHAIGSICLIPDPRRCGAPIYVMGYSLHPDYWGYGIVPEAARAVMQFGFTELLLPMITIYHYADNLRSQRVVEKLGFTYEGTLRKSTLLYNGSMPDSLCYSMTSTEYRCLKQQAPTQGNGK